jgi:hypothetical protein
MFIDLSDGKRDGEQCGQIENAAASSNSGHDQGVESEHRRQQRHFVSLQPRKLFPSPIVLSQVRPKRPNGRFCSLIAESLLFGAEPDAFLQYPVGTPRISSFLTQRPFIPLSLGPEKHVVGERGAVQFCSTRSFCIDVQKFFLNFQS